MPYTLSFTDRYLRTPESKVTSDTTLSQVFYNIPDNEETEIFTKWTGKQWHKLLSCIETGADLMFPDEANEIIWQFIKTLLLPPEFSEVEEDCLNFLPSASFVDFFPQDPYNQPDYIPPDYLVPPFKVNTDLEYPEFLGYVATDVMVNSAAISIDPIDIATLNFPQFTIKVRGAGQIEIDLLTIVGGGLLVYKIGEPPNIIDIIEEGTIGDDVVIVDLNNDSVGVPPESDIVSAQEINIEAESGVLTTVYFVFVPVLDDSLTPLRFGGGVRQIGLCGFEGEGAVMLEDVRFNTENCTFEKRIAGEWEMIVGGDEWLLCVEALMATKAEIKEAIIESAEEISARFLSGVAGNVEGGVTINPDGTIEVSDGGVPPDDPLTTDFNEQLAAEMGGAISVAYGLELLFDKVDAYYGATNGSPATAESACQAAIKAYFPNDGAIMDSAITNYYSYRATNPRILFNTSDAFEQYLFCNGANEQGFNRWLVDVSAYAEQKRVIVSGLVTGLSDAFFSDYFARGVVVPSTEYRAAPCTKFATESLTFTGSDLTGSAYKVGSVLNKISHRVLVNVSGQIPDTGGGVQDFFWRVDGAGVKTFIGITGTYGTGQVNQAWVSWPTSSEVPYRTDGIYQFTRDINPTTAEFLSIRRKIINESGSGGAFNMTITDLGQAN